MPPPISNSTHTLCTTEEILAQPAGFLREVMRALCADDAVRTRASILLSKLLAKGDEKLQLDGSKPLLPPGVKLCLQCKQEFMEAENAEQECQFHDGRVEIRNKYWRNHNHTWDGPIDTPENRKYDPEGFQWSCCESDLDAPGCTHRSHQAAKEAEKVKESHSLEDGNETAPRAKKVKLGGDDTTAKDSITGASGAAIILPEPFGKLDLPKRTQKDVKPEILPEGSLVCVQCKETFLEGSNRPRSCWFHDGYLALEPTMKVWDNFDFDDEAEIDTDEMREEVPEGFVYQCCGELGLSKGCKWGSHLSNGNLHDAVPTGTAADTTNGTNGDIREGTTHEVHHVHDPSGESTTSIQAV